MKGIATRLAILLIRAYRLLLGPFLPPACRFHPTCSRYAEEAIARHGMIHGSVLAVRRVARCHPFHPGGYDPVPDAATRPQREGP